MNRSYADLTQSSQISYKRDKSNSQTRMLFKINNLKIKEYETYKGVIKK